jgi:hypothetical protein
MRPRGQIRPPPRHQHPYPGTAKADAAAPKPRRRSERRGRRFDWVRSPGAGEAPFRYRIFPPP